MLKLVAISLRYLRKLNLLHIPLSRKLLKLPLLHVDENPISEFIFPQFSVIGNVFSIHTIWILRAMYFAPQSFATKYANEIGNT